MSKDLATEFTLRTEGNSTDEDLYLELRWMADKEEVNAVTDIMQEDVLKHFDCMDATAKQ